MSSKTIAESLKIKGSLSRDKLVVRKTKKEIEILKSLNKWHNQSRKGNFFIGELKRRVK